MSRHSVNRAVSRAGSSRHSRCLHAHRERPERQLACDGFPPAFVRRDRTFRFFSGLAQSHITPAAQIGPPSLHSMGGRMLSAHRTMIVLAVAGLVAGCATRPVTSRDAMSRFSEGTVLTAEELGKIPRQGSLMEAMERLRPQWLTSRGATSWVVIDGAPPAELSVLQIVQASDVREVRLERSSSSVGHAAFAASGAVVVGTTIVVSTRRGGRGQR
jgi:hypothetical protein